MHNILKVGRDNGGYSTKTECSFAVAPAPPVAKATQIASRVTKNPRSIYIGSA